MINHFSIISIKFETTKINQIETTAHKHVGEQSLTSPTNGGYPPVIKHGNGKSIINRIF
jgi:hypothetical protein